jgi:hypothetical protein
MDAAVFDITTGQPRHRLVGIVALSILASLPAAADDTNTFTEPD